MEPEDTTGIEESDIETMVDASVEQMDSSQNMDDSERMVVVRLGKMVHTTTLILNT